MKLIAKGLFVILGAALSFVAVQSTSSEIISWPDPITGVVIECEPGISGLQVEEADGDIISIWGMGSTSYWEELGVAFPQVGDTITVGVYEVLCVDGSTKLVADYVLVGNFEIDLRDDDGLPLWTKTQKGFSQEKGVR